jgi:hypothetical protein
MSGFIKMTKLSQDSLRVRITLRSEPFDHHADIN